MQNQNDRNVNFTSIYSIGEIDIRTQLKRYWKIVLNAVKSQKKILEKKILQFGGMPCSERFKQLILSSISKMYFSIPESQNWMIQNSKVKKQWLC